MRILLLCTFICLLAGCGSSDLTPAGQTVIAKIAALPVTCIDGPDCREKWSRASEWISRNSVYHLAYHSKYFLQTSRPSASGTDQAIKVTRYARADGVYVFTFAAWCNNGFYCSPSETGLKASFVKFVLGEKQVEAEMDAAAQTDPAVHEIMHSHTPLVNK